MEAAAEVEKTRGLRVVRGTLFTGSGQFLQTKGSQNPHPVAPNATRVGHPLFCGTILNLEKVQGGLSFAFYLSYGALFRSFFGTPADEFGAVAEAAASEVIETNFYYQLRIERLPLCRTLCAPAAGTSGSLARESRRLDQGFQFFG